jgi:hypothetical protein
MQKVNGSDDGVQQWESLSFGTLCIVWNFKYEKQRFGNIICFRRQVRGEDMNARLGPLESANLNHLLTRLNVSGGTVISKR